MLKIFIEKLFWNSIAYWSQGEVLDQRMFLAAATTFPREPILDDESRRLLDDSNLIISRERLLLLDAIGQGNDHLN